VRPVFTHELAVSSGFLLGFNGFQTLAWRDVAGDLFPVGCRAIQSKVAWAFLKNP
jgi:hypothetical protein